VQTLRPLGFGEILDRSITLYLRNFLPFVGIVLVMLVPFSALQYAVDSIQAGQIALIFHQITHPESKVPAAAAIPHVGAPTLVAIGLGALITVLCEPFVYAAVAQGVARLYRGERVEFRACFGPVLRAWPKLLGFVALVFAIGLVLYVTLVFVAVVLLLGAVFLGRAGAIAIGIMAAVGVLAMLALFFALIWVILAMTFALYAIVLENATVFGAIGLGMRRIFSRTEIWRALGFSVVSSLIAGTASMLLSIIALVAEYYGLIWLDVALKSLSSALVLPFPMILLAVYYFDVRVRREGLDLEQRLSQLEPGSA
jgi:hypothetical protein